jgi:hypothetical protein
MKENIKLAMEVAIRKVISGKTKSVEIFGIYPNDVIEYVTKELKGKHKEDWDTNGWQWDYWMDFEIDNEKYTLSGSGYYGGATFGLNTDWKDKI